MKKQEYIQIKALDLRELSARAKNLRTEIANLTLDKNMKKLKDLKMVSKKKKELAQVLTVMKQKELLIELEIKVQEDKSNKSVIASEAKQSKSGENINKIATSSDVRRSPRNDKKKRSSKV
ncbi:50S ribosomal protein L29 [Candidatus Daviesbacteria bacterium RIFCSPLOWO2_02_FULL_41_8]|uniref:Large ribosomal subunit protein uL29 n=3 Tax=Candidatus Daviesiibacteriota TaxID=1752718 RepID=A0A1F5NM72_9BACT|nr:MAG: 50S ribosomal protein L29 [Candidatus Daviesbacteria bacterium RIFCSPHIGHO2_01_FULL_41_23]OGE32791.1 MAG: 50S ribosomal protein L29 [Candidatus Daviesbacteria bacterium RIFCSPHIGHO2_02_FULL_41_10]OGE62133.1 MAG: 50S ribosomal protein L29 [Candidatus Daviesbacteria bacterium RIFCSPLOWO2_01_FULL_41_32]OGE78614.1 MAG: 50S ribosomal protein L29 [Candidatus Daviesbacteria bacterium RIFCSPLOWO2_02_FULL_41_8]